MSKQPLIDQLDQAVAAILADPAGEPPAVDASLVDLLQVARDLRELPAPSFKARLRSDLERKASMSTQTSTAKIIRYRPGFRSVTPYVLPPSADFIDFAKQVFDAEQTLRGDTSPTSFHAELRIGNSMMMVGVGSGRTMPGAFIAYVPAADEVYAQALKAGAVSLEPVNEEYGDRLGVVRDPAGNDWCISTHLGANYIPEHGQSLITCFRPRGAARFISFIESAFGAEVIQRWDTPEGRVPWASVRIGNSVVGVSDPGNHEWAGETKLMIYLHVADADATYEQALLAGAQSIHAPVNQPYGDRNGGVTDEWGNMWFMATPIDESAV
jgi:PhnB protein